MVSLGEIKKEKEMSTSTTFRTANVEAGTDVTVNVEVIEIKARNIILVSSRDLTYKISPSLYTKI